MTALSSARTIAVALGHWTKRSKLWTISLTRDGCASLWSGIQAGYCGCRRRRMKVVDGDGHVMEETAKLAKFLPDPFKHLTDRQRIFPPLDHFHAFIGETP